MKCFALALIAMSVEASNPWGAYYHQAPQKPQAHHGHHGNGHSSHHQQVSNPWAAHSGHGHHAQHYANPWGSYGHHGHTQEEPEEPEIPEGWFSADQQYNNEKEYKPLSM